MFRLTHCNWGLECLTNYYVLGLRANPLAWRPGHVKLASDKWKLWKNLF